MREQDKGLSGQVLQSVGIAYAKALRQKHFGELEEQENVSCVVRRDFERRMIGNKGRPGPF